MDRRTFIKTAAAAAAIAAVHIEVPLHAQNAAPAAAPAPGASGSPDLVLVRNGDPVTMFQKGISALGGISRYVKPGQSVVIKPNAAWDQPPQMGANTTPELVAEIIRECFAAGAKKVEVFDHTCNEWQACYKNSGIEAAVKAAGGTMLSADDKHAYRMADRPHAVLLRQAMIFHAILDCDVFINVPILKHHGGATMTAALKNFMGIVLDRGFFHKQGLPQCIADAPLYRKPDLNVIDAFRVMISHGPRGVSEKDVRMMRYQILSSDIVAADTVAARLLNYTLAQVPYIQLAEKNGLGTTQVDKLNVARLEC